MRLWIALTAWSLTAFGAIGLIISLLGLDFVSAGINFGILSLGVFDLVNLRILKTEAARAYGRMALSQGVLGLILAALLAILPKKLDHYMQDEAILQRLLARMHRIPGNEGISLFDLRATLEFMSPLISVLCFAAAALVLLSQAILSGKLYRKAQPPAPPIIEGNKEGAPSAQTEKE